MISHLNLIEEELQDFMKIFKLTHNEAIDIITNKFTSKYNGIPYGCILIVNVYPKMFWKTVWT